MNDNNTQYYAKSKREDGTQELVRDHLEKVREMAGVFGEQIGSRKTISMPRFSTISISPSRRGVN